MALRARAGSALRWRSTTHRADVSDFARVVAWDGLAAIANGYDSGFATCWPPGSRLILDLFVDQWSRCAGSVRERLGAAFDGAHRGFLEQAPALTSPDPDVSGDLPGAVLLAAALDGTVVHIAWIGGDVAILMRGARALSTTTPHTLVERLRREHPEVTDFGAVPSVLDRTIGESTNPAPPAHLAADVEAGDTLVLLSRAGSHGARMPIDDIARLATSSGAPALIAEELAAAAFAATEGPYVAAVVLRFDEEIDLASK